MDTFSPVSALEFGKQNLYPTACPLEPISVSFLRKLLSLLGSHIENIIKVPLSTVAVQNSLKVFILIFFLSCYVQATGKVDLNLFFLALETDRKIKGKYILRL